MDPNVNINDDEHQQQQQSDHNNNNNNNNGNNNNLIVKRKRTKRQRPHSLISFTIAAAAAPEEDEEEDEEELDMANCLILLATGACGHNLRDEDSGKFTSKILLESPAAGKAGIYVYQCKTCYRTFPSFQALGGHRTSHKKTKVNGTTSFVNELSDPDETEPAKFINSKNFNSNVYKTSSKVHECSICGAEFNSGQALGGHMRRHRVMLSTRPINISQSPTPAGPTPIGPSPGPGPGPVLSLSLDLDLNLPVVSESEIVHRQTALVLSTGPAMVVGCHY